MASAIERLAGKATKLSDVETRKQNYRIGEEFDYLDISDGEWHEIRILPAPGIFVHGKHWIDLTFTKDGKEKTITIPKPCHNLDKNTGQFDTTKSDPIFENREYFSSRGEDGSTGFGAHYYMCVIDRSLQENEPRKKPQITKSEKKTQFKEKGSKSWTPVRVLRLPKGAVEKIIKLGARNVVKTKKGKETFDLSDLKHGRDIAIMFDNDAAPANKWDVQLSDSKAGPLTASELEYLIFDIEGAIDKDLSQETPEATAKWVKEYLKALNTEEDDDDEDDKPKKKSKDKKSKGKAKQDEDDDEDDDDDLDLDLDLDDDDDEDDKPKKKKKGKDKSSKDKKSKKDKSKKKKKK